MVGQNGGPRGTVWAGRFWNDPEALERVVDEGDGFALGRTDRPRASEEVEGGVEIDAALDMESEMEVEQGGWRKEQEFGTLFLESLFPGLIGSQLGGAAAGVFVVPIDLSFE